MRGIRAGIAVLGLVLASFAYAQSGTEFTYQGSLSAGHTPVSSSADLVFTIWDAPSSGTQISNTVRIDNVSVVDGLFTVPIDFGIAPYGEAPRWLQIAVRTPHDPTNTASHDTLVPRQVMSRSPYSIQTRGIFVDDQNNVGIGTTTPDRQLDLEANESIARLTSTSINPGIHSRLQFSTADAPGIFTPLGSIDYTSAAGTIIASIQGTKAGSEGGRLALRAGATTTHAQLDLLSGGSILVGDVGQVGTEAGVDTFFNTQGGFFGIGLDDPSHPLHVSADHLQGSLLSLSTGAGPAIVARGGSDANASFGGTIVVGDTSGPNLAMDSDEIMARDNAQPTTLRLNSAGGDVTFGQHGTMPAYAYGLVRGNNGTLTSGSNNIAAVTHVDDGIYMIEFTEPLDWKHDIVLASTTTGIPMSSASCITTHPGVLWVYTHYQDLGQYDIGFSFVVFKPQYTIADPV